MEDHMRRIGILSVVLATALTVGCDRSKNAANESSAVGTAGKADGVSGRDKDFVRDVSTLNMGEIELSQTALQRSSDTELKKFAQLMVDDHTAAGDKLKTLASQYNIPLASQLDDKHSKLQNKLSQKTALDFDKEYIDAMVDDHKDLLDKLEGRVDKEKLAEWKAEMADRAAGRKVVEQGQTIAVIPEKSDDAVTMALNTWAAGVYPIAAGHLEAAKVLQTAIKKRTTD
jgi:putative membrane protein